MVDPIVEQRTFWSVHTEWKCKQCGTIKEFCFPDITYDCWRKGEVNIQDAFPHMSRGDREIMISGFCGDCFEKLLSELVDEDEKENEQREKLNG